MQDSKTLNLESITTFLRPVLRDDIFIAYRPMNFKDRLFVPVMIQRSISVLYKVSTVHEHVEHYDPITYNNTDILNAIHTLFSGSPTEKTVETLLNVKVRSGWMDKSLSNLTFEPIIALYIKFVEDKLERKDNQKLRQVLSAITMSKRDMVKCYDLPQPAMRYYKTPLVHLDEDFNTTNEHIKPATRLETQNANPI